MDRFLVHLFALAGTYLLVLQPSAIFAATPETSMTLDSAIRAGNAQALRAALDQGADPNQRIGRLTALMLAAARDDAEAVRVLLEHGAHINVLDDMIGTSALHLASQAGSLEVAKLLIERGAHVNLQAPSHGFTPLMNAVWHRQANVVSYLLSLDTINVEVTNALGLKAHELIDLFMIGPTIPSQVRSQHVEEAKRFRQMFDEHARRRAQRIGSQKLMAIVVNAEKRLAPDEQLAALRKEIAAGADVNAIAPVMSSGYDAHTPVLAAALFGQARIVEALLAAGADPTIGCGYMNANPAHKAASFGHTEVMRALAAHDTFSRIRDAQGPYNGYTPLMDAVWHGHLDAARVLLEAGADPHLRGHDGKSALDLAREFGYPHIVVLLTQYAERP